MYVITKQRKDNGKIIQITVEELREVVLHLDSMQYVTPDIELISIIQVKT